MEGTIRLNKYLSDAGVCSRREADRLVEEGKVRVEECYASQGPIMKRVKPRAQGRAYRIEKRMSHITIVLNEK